MFRARLVTALFLLVGFLAALFKLPEFHWAALMLGMIVLGAWEWGRLATFSQQGQRLFALLVLVVGVTLLPGVIPGDWAHQALFWGILAAVPLWLVLAPLWLLKMHRETRKPLMAVAGVAALLPGWLALVALRNTSPWLVLGLMATVWIADSAAYFAGKAFGRRKLAPQISPGKTWEGVAGALVAVTLYGGVVHVLTGISLWLVVGLWGVTVLSIVGDLFESLLKRQAGLKDSGTVLPGHGGVLDRIDGLLPTLPLAAFYLHFPLYYLALYE